MTNAFDRIVATGKSALRATAIFLSRQSKVEREGTLELSSRGRLEHNGDSGLIVDDKPHYLHLRPDHEPPEFASCPFRAVIIADETVSETWLNQIAKWIVDKGCLYVVAWGVDCEAWHDSVDWASLEIFDYGEIPSDRFIMTTWHNNEPLSEALWFAGQCAFHPDVDLIETVILHISEEAHATRVLQLYRASQTMLND